MPRAMPRNACAAPLAPPQAVKPWQKCIALQPPCANAEKKRALTTQSLGNLGMCSTVVDLLLLV